MKTRYLSATEFKAHCLALLDEVGEGGGTITVTKRGRPVATVTSPAREKWKSPAGILAGRARIAVDLEKFDMADLWEVARDSERRKPNAPPNKKAPR